jgi:2-keto-4-pentenoate hydratase/2-oxohepta-3-ene-1,7-dioic acid hydratase in catechol pathway
MCSTNSTRGNADLRCWHARGSVHYEAEMLLRLDENLQVDAVSLGLDLTLRDLQAKLKKDGHPWEVAKVTSMQARCDKL